MVAFPWPPDPALDPADGPAPRPHDLPHRIVLGALFDMARRRRSTFHTFTVDLLLQAYSLCSPVSLLTSSATAYTAQRVRRA